MKKQLKAKLKSNTLLIVVSISFVIALGFIYWQNFIFKQDSTQTVDVPYSVGSDSTTPHEVRYLTLDNWGVRVPLKDNSYYYRSGDYKTLSSTDQVYSISTKSLRVACGTDDATVGSIERLPNSDNNESKIGASNVKGTKVFGEYLFIFTSPDTTCSDSLEVIRLQQNATREFISLLGRIEPLK